MKTVAVGAAKQPACETVERAEAVDMDKTIKAAAQCKDDIDAKFDIASNNGKQCEVVVLSCNAQVVESAKADNSEVREAVERNTIISDLPKETVPILVGDTDDEDEDDYTNGEWMFGADGVKTPRVSTNFRVQLKASSEKNRIAYTVIKNRLNSIRGITFRQNGRLEKANYKGEPIAYIGVARKHIKLWLALDPNEYEPTRYYQRDESEKPKYAKVPMLVKIGSDRALSRVEELLNELVTKYELQFKRKYEDKALQELAYTLKCNALLKEKEPWLLREVIHVHDADSISNEDADRYLESVAKSGHVVHNLATVSLDTIDESFIDGQKVTLERLKTKGLIGAEYDGYRVTAGERLTKPLHIIANDFSIAAVKMIVLTGGRAARIRSL